MIFNVNWDVKDPTPNMNQKMIIIRFEVDTNKLNVAKNPDLCIYTLKNVNENCENVQCLQTKTFKVEGCFR
ncbi:hypothetical protein BLOT_004626 [Blomia tropicalis]|nr:hypothetical protein BLOT_004626 [Blomia tropicalis]